MPSIVLALAGWLTVLASRRAAVADDGRGGGGGAEVGCSRSGCCDNGTDAAAESVVYDVRWCGFCGWWLSVFAGPNGSTAASALCLLGGW